jgi:Mg-chelatase subunit ChlD
MQRMAWVAGIVYCAFISLPTTYKSPQAPSTGSALAHATASGQQTDQLAHVLINVMDSAGNSTAAPAKNDLSLQIDGKNTDVEDVSSLNDSPLLFSILLDVSASTNGFSEKEFAAALKLYRALSERGNRGFLILFETQVHANDRPMTSDAVEQILQKLLATPRQGSTALYDAIGRAMEKEVGSMAAPGQFRRAVIVFTDGEDNVSRQSMDATLRGAQKAGVPVITVGLTRNWGESPTGRRMERETIETLSNDSGGFATFLDEQGNLVGPLPDILQGQCEVSFKTAGLGTKKSYSLKIKSVSKGVRILAPRQYFAR